MNFLKKRFNLIIAIFITVIAASIAIQPSISFYNMKFGRDLVFIGLSQYLLAAAIFSFSIGFLLIDKDKNKGYEAAEESYIHYAAFSIGIILIIISLLKESSLI